MFSDWRMAACDPKVGHSWVTEGFPKAAALGASKFRRLLGRLRAVRLCRSAVDLIAAFKAASTISQNRLIDGINIP